MWRSNDNFKSQYRWNKTPPKPEGFYVNNADRTIYLLVVSLKHTLQRDPDSYTDRRSQVVVTGCTGGVLGVWTKQCFSTLMRDQHPQGYLFSGLIQLQLHKLVLKLRWLHVHLIWISAVNIIHSVQHSNCMNQYNLVYDGLDVKMFVSLNINWFSSRLCETIYHDTRWRNNKGKAN